MSEVNVNIEKLKVRWVARGEEVIPTLTSFLLQEVPKQSLSILASVCMITSLAYLKICFPEAVHWQQPNDKQPPVVSEYVDRYLGTPIHEAANFSHPVA